MPTETKYATCSCGVEMKPDNAGCRDTHLVLNGKGKKGAGGKRYARIRHNERECCGDCNATYGRVHHFGCDLEQCPKCGGQLLGCDCNWTHSCRLK